jgi:hypothetical protein
MELSTITRLMGWNKKLDNDSARKEVGDMIHALCRMIQQGNFPSLISNIQFDGDKTILLMFDGKKIVFDPALSVPVLIYPEMEVDECSSRSPLMPYEKEKILDGRKSYEGAWKTK